MSEKSLTFDELFERCKEKDLTLKDILPGLLSNLAAQGDADAIAALERQKQAALASAVAVVPETHAVVPKEPTQEMVSAGHVATWAVFDDEDAALRSQYAAMLAAAPPAPVRSVSAERLAELERLAARYQWLKNHAHHIEWFAEDESGARTCHRPTLDADIDRAMGVTN